MPVARTSVQPPTVENGAERTLSLKPRPSSSGLVIRTSHGFANETDSRESTSDSQAFLILCESPCCRRFLLMVIRISHEFASQAQPRESDTHSHMPIWESPYSALPPSPTHGSPRKPLKLPQNPGNCPEILEKGFVVCTRLTGLETGV